MLAGESKRRFEVWRPEGLTFDKIRTKLKEHARGLRLDEDAKKGKQAVAMNWADQGVEAQGSQEEQQADQGDINKLSQAKCSFCNQKGHSAAPCWKAKAKGEAKGKGEDGGR